MTCLGRSTARGWSEGERLLALGFRKLAGGGAAVKHVLPREVLSSTLASTSAQPHTQASSYPFASCWGSQRDGQRPGQHQTPALSTALRVSGHPELVLRSSRRAQRNNMCPGAYHGRKASLSLEVTPKGGYPLEMGVKRFLAAAPDSVAAVARSGN